MVYIYCGVCPRWLRQGIYRAFIVNTATKKNIYIFFRCYGKALASPHLLIAMQIDASTEVAQVPSWGFSNRLLWHIARVYVVCVVSKTNEIKNIYLYKIHVYLEWKSKFVIQSASAASFLQNVRDAQQKKDAARSRIVYVHKWHHPFSTPHTHAYI